MADMILVLSVMIIAKKIIGCANNIVMSSSAMVVRMADIIFVMSVMIIAEQCKWNIFGNAMNSAMRPCAVVVQVVLRAAI
jgi:hypothetical protein